jgi:hypothetical protein
MVTHGSNRRAEARDEGRIKLETQSSLVGAKDAHDANSRIGDLARCALNVYYSVIP